MSDDYTRERDFNRAQARYDAQEPPECDDDREPETCGHCSNPASGSWSDDVEDEDGFHAGTFYAVQTCAACDHPLCLSCIDGEHETACPALGRVPYPFEVEGVTLAAWRENQVATWNRNAERGYCTRVHADRMIRDILENYGPKDGAA